MYPLQLLTGDVPLATILGMSATTQLEAISGSGLVPAASIPIVSEMLAPQRGTKCWHHSSNLKQEEEETGEPNHTTEECPHQNGKREGYWQRLLKSPAVRPFSRSHQ